MAVTWLLTSTPESSAFPWKTSTERAFAHRPFLSARYETALDDDETITVYLL